MKQLFIKGSQVLGLLTFLSAGAVENEGYWVNKDGQVWRNSSGACWRTKDWEPRMANAACDPELQRSRPAASRPAPKRGLTNNDFGSPAKFDLNETEIRNTDKRHLRNVAREVKNLPADKVIVIEGHADATGQAARNRELSMQRAQEAKGYLVSEGVPASKIYTEARGSSEPVVNLSACAGMNGDALADCLEVNRRVDVYLR